MQVIKDDQGRARIGIDEAQPCQVVLLDREGRLVASVQLERDGDKVACWLHDADEQLVAGVVVEDGRAHVIQVDGSEPVYALAPGSPGRN